MADHSTTAHQWDKLLAQQDTLIATCLDTFRTLGKRVTAATRKDDRDFFAHLSQRAAHFLHPNDVKQFWQTIRANIPKFRKRRFSVDPLQIEELEDKWHPYFETLEAGSQIAADVLVRDCHDFQLRHGSQFDVCTLDDIPSLFMLEDSLRETAAGKSTGLDPIPSAAFHSQASHLAKYFFNLVLKIHIWQMEPIQAKGGILALIPKTGGAQPQNYRGIMLLGTLSKRLHALLRKQLLPTLIAHKPQGQIGGFPHQQVTYGAQAVGIFARVVSNAGLSSAVIYFDLKNAFHKLVRELVLGVRHDAAFEQVVNMLTTEQVDPRGVQAWSKLPGLLQRLHAPPLLTQLLADVHHHTWFILPNHPRITLTRKGTRPGSPLADVIFHALMLDITIEIENWLDQQRDYCSIREELSLPMPAVVWSDDLAICWASRSAQNLVPGIQDLISIVHQIFSRRGFSLNMNYGKTMAVPHFRGEKAPALRKEFVLTANPGVLCPLRDGDSQWLHFASKYKHLGVYQSADGGFGPELHYRCGVAHSTFVALAKPILCNRHLPVRVRINL